MSADFQAGLEEAVWVIAKKRVARLTVKGGLKEGVSWPMASNMVLSAYMRDQKARPPLLAFSCFTWVVASFATVHSVSVAFTSYKCTKIRLLSNSL